MQVDSLSTSLDKTYEGMMSMSWQSLSLHTAAQYILCFQIVCCIKFEQAREEVCVGGGGERERERERGGGGGEGGRREGERESSLCLFSVISCQ